MQKKLCLPLLAALSLCLAVSVLADTGAANAEAAIDLTGVAAALLGLLATLLTAYVLPWLKAKLGAEQYNNTMSIIRILVKAAEKIFTGPGRGGEKLDYVKRELEKRGLTYDESKVEAAVWELGGAVWGTVTDGKEDA